MFDRCKLVKFRSKKGHFAERDGAGNTVTALGAVTKIYLFEHHLGSFIHYHHIYTFEKTISDMPIMFSKSLQDYYCRFYLIDSVIVYNFKLRYVIIERIF